MARSTPRGPIEPEIGAEGSFRAGYVALVGRPNVGKSTILNRLLGQKIAATTHKPQTTQRNLVGILNPPGAQILILDTPGHHAAKGVLNRYMVAEAERAMGQADVLAYVVEARDDGKITPGNDRIAERVMQADKPIVLLVNKVDKVKEKTRLLAQLETYHAHLGKRLVAVVPMSASRGTGLEDAVKEIGRALPEGPALVQPDLLTQASERSIVAEFIREKVMLETTDELPYSAAVTIEVFEDKRPKIVRIQAVIHVERDSQKGIIIGRRGERLRAIGTRARLDIEHLLGAKVFLDLHVRVQLKWSASAKAMANLGFGADDREGVGAPFDAEFLKGIVTPSDDESENYDPFEGHEDSFDDDDDDEDEE